MSFLLADDTTRCRLSFIPGVEGSDYINANHIDVCYKNIYRIYTEQENLVRFLFGDLANSA